jgi:hypothetical protein
MDDDNRSAPGPLALFHRYLRVRSPAGLMADAFIVLVLYMVVTHLWAGAWEATPIPQRTAEAESLFVATLRLSTLMQSLSTFLFWAAIFMLVWAVARLLAEAARGMSNDEG